MTPNWYVYADGRLHISTPRSTKKCTNIQRDGRMAVCVVPEPAVQKYVTLRGPVEVRQDDTIWAETRLIVERYMSGDAVAARMAKLMQQDRVLLSLTPEHVLMNF